MHKVTRAKRTKERSTNIKSTLHGTGVDASNGGGAQPHLRPGVLALTFHRVPEAHVGAAVHGPGVVVGQAQGELHLGRGRQALGHVAVVASRVATQRALLRGVAQHAPVVVVLRSGAQDLHTQTQGRGQS